MKPNCVVTLASGRQVLGESRGYYADGTAYVEVEGGCATNYPQENVRPLEDKDWPREGLETK
jgi:hypothetical protein